jgi:hypothetical protein
VLTLIQDAGIVTSGKTAKIIFNRNFLDYLMNAQPVIRITISDNLKRMVLPIVQIAMELKTGKLLNSTITLQLLSLTGNMLMFHASNVINLRRRVQNHLSGIK